MFSFVKDKKRKKKDELKLKHIFQYRQEYWDAMEHCDSVSKNCEDQELVILAYDRLELAKKRLNESIKSAKRESLVTDFKHFVNI